MYVKVKASGSPMESVAQVVAVSFAKRHLKVKVPEQPCLSMFVYMPPNSINSKLPYTNQFRCLDKAAILTPEDKMNPDGSAADPWGLFSMQQVEEVKCLLRVLPIWAAALVFHIPIVQQQTFVVFQALQSNRRLGKTSFQIYDRLLVRFLQRLKGKEGGITLLQRIESAFFSLRSPC
ncbi:hypothetical protein ACFX1X_015772 [Malus domestica]